MDQMTKLDLPSADKNRNDKGFNVVTGAGVTAVLGPTNTGKTHYALERMIAHPNGVIGLPLRLLAREVYGRLCDKVGVNSVALITGEEKISPKNARFTVCTVEAMPQYGNWSFVAIDEVQLAADLERGHIFTDRILNLRGQDETLLLGSQTMAGLLRALLPGISIYDRTRMSTLTYDGAKKISRLPRRSAIVAFSANEVYAIAELVRRQRGGAAVVLGALSPRTRNAQVELYQNGDVDYLIATDAIGMGLNLDVRHVAFAQDQKFDGVMHRPLTPAEMAQIAGRAGRHIRDGTFGVTSRVPPLADPMIEALETHQFAPLKRINWRSRELMFDDPISLVKSLDAPPAREGLTKALTATDQKALEVLFKEPEIRDICVSRHETQTLWEVCQVPDYRRIAPADHTYLLGRLFLNLMRDGKIDEDWFAEQVKRSDHLDGEIDTLSNRIAHIRTWTFLSNKSQWLQNDAYWKEKTRQIENALSDALHERLTKRFVDRRTSVLMKRLRENKMLEAQISDNGNITVEGHHVGQLQGFRFTADHASESPDAKAIRAAASKVLAAEIDKRATRLVAAPNNDFAIGDDGTLRWLGGAVGKLSASEDVLAPRVILLADDHLTGVTRDFVEARLNRFVGFHIETTLKPLIDLKTAEALEGMARGVAFRLIESMGVVPRRDIASDVRGLDQEARGALRKLGVRFGAYHIFIPALLKPAPSTLICFLWALKEANTSLPGLTEIPQLSASGRTSVVVDENFDKRIYNLAGFRVLGARAVRVDILERLADLIRPALGWKPIDQKTPKSSTDGETELNSAKDFAKTTEDLQKDAALQASGNTVPQGAYDGNSFVVTSAMLSILGATHDDMETILKALGYIADVKPAKEANAVLYNNFPQMKVEADERIAKNAEKQIDENTSTDDEIQSKTEKEAIIVWRQARGNKRNYRHGKSDHKAGGTSSQSRHKTSSKNGEKNSKLSAKKKSRGTAQKVKALDPDSPFSALAALKGNLEKPK